MANSEGHALWNAPFGKRVERYNKAGVVAQVNFLAKVERNAGETTAVKTDFAVETQHSVFYFKPSRRLAAHNPVDLRGVLVEGSSKFKSDS